MPPFGRLTPEIVRQITAVVGDEHVLSDPRQLRAYASDETEDLFFLPEAVVRPASTLEVAASLRIASRHRLPVTPRGAGTGLSGGALPVHGGLVLTLERLNGIVEIDEANLTATVEAGVVTGELHRRVEALGLFYPPDPASAATCSIGGNLAEDAAGPRSCKYGSTRRWVLGLEAVLADGTVLTIGGKNRKDVTGYDLTQLLVGSEGTLAVLTRALLRLTVRPSASLTSGLVFAGLEAAARAVVALYAAGLDPTSCEVVEGRGLELVDALEPLPPELAGAGAVLLVAFDGPEVDPLLDGVARLARCIGRQALAEPIVALDDREQRRLWQVRRRVGEAVKRRSAYKEIDAVVPRAALAELVVAARSAAAAHGLEAVCYGHAGDGNLHVNLLRGDLDDEAWRRARDRAEDALVGSVLALGGAVTGEHGVGWTQRRHLNRALGTAAVELQRRLKRAFDPVGILNPSKVLPDARPAAD